MPPVHASAAPANFELDEARHTIRFTRRVAAAPQAVFDAWTQPDQVILWWDPAGEPLLRCEIDLRVGGRFLFVNRSRPDMPFAGVYREVSPPARLLFDAMGAEGRVLIEASPEGSTLTVEIACANEDHLRQFVAMGVADGTSQTLDNLVALLGG
jgi:uncharacterized protein YndB with AHSA1/START domain